jgi:putative NADPH-quinone reductase
MKIAIVQGNPDPAGGHFGHEVKSIEVARLDFPLLRTSADWQAAAPGPIRESQEILKWAQHYLLRPGFAFGEAKAGRLPKQLLKGRSARIVVTMGMPAFFYRIYCRSHSVKNLRRNILEFARMRKLVP